MDSDDTDMGSWETNSQRDSDEKGENVEISSTILNDLKRLFPSIDNWYLIGSGSFGSVYLGKTDGGFHTLVKRIHLDVFDQQEVTILRKIKQNCRQYFTCIRKVLKYNKYVYIELEYIPNSSDLFEHLNKNFLSLTLKDKCKIITSLLEGLKLLHSLNIVHRDIKEENILIDKNGNVKFIDFGGSCSLDDQNCLSKVSGTLQFLPPERFNHEENMPFKKADIWATGIVFCSILFGQDLWYKFDNNKLKNFLTSATDSQIRARVNKLYSEFAIEFGTNQFDPLRNLILQMLKIDPNSRPDAESLLVIANNICK